MWHEPTPPAADTLPLSGTLALCSVEGQAVLDETSALTWNVPENRCVCVSQTAWTRSGEQGPVAILACLPLSWRCKAPILFNFPRLPVNKRFAGVRDELDSDLSAGDLVCRRGRCVSTRSTTPVQGGIGYGCVEHSEHSGETIMNSSEGFISGGIWGK